MKLHALLRRQLRRAGLESDAPPSSAQWSSFLETIDRTYVEVDQDRYTIERSLATSSRELRDVYDDLKQSSETQLASERDKLRMNVAIHEATLEAAADGILIVDMHREIIGFNQRFVALWRIPHEVADLRDDARLIASVLDQIEDPSGFVERVDYLYEHRAETSLDLIHCMDGRVIERQSSPVFLDERVPYGRVWFFRDITDNWQHENQLRDAKDLAEKASRAKSDFLANMSHELRTPLNAILGFGRVLERMTAEVLTADQQEYLRYITQAGDHMLDLVNDLLDLRTLEETKLDLQSVDLISVVREATDVVKALADEKLIVLSISISPELPLVLGDRRAILQVLINLLSNAIKFTPERGFVSVSAAAIESAILLGVHDTGIGIAAADQPRLFTYFEQLGVKHMHNMKGSGIGLALTKALVAKQGGSIHVESVQGKGSTFKVSLKVAQ